MPIKQSDLMAAVKRVKDRIPGGKADNMPDSAFSRKSLKAGVKVEREHTRNPAIAREIAKDHLKESPRYYRALKKMESGLEKKASLVVDAILRELSRGENPVSG